MSELQLLPAVHDEVRFPAELAEHVERWRPEFAKKGQQNLPGCRLERLDLAPLYEGARAPGMKFRKTWYFDFLATNRMLDDPGLAAHGGGLATIRERYAPIDGILDPGSLSSSPLSNRLGMALTVITADGKAVLGLRGSHLAFETRKIHTSVGEGMQWPRGAQDPGDWEPAFQSPDPAKTAVRGAYEELGLKLGRDEILVLGMGVDLDYAWPFIYEVCYANKYQWPDVLQLREEGVPPTASENLALLAVTFEPAPVGRFLVENAARMPSQSVVNLLLALLDSFGRDEVDKTFLRLGSARAGLASAKRRGRRYELRLAGASVPSPFLLGTRTEDALREADRRAGHPGPHPGPLLMTAQQRDAGYYQKRSYLWPAPALHHLVDHGPDHSRRVAELAADIWLACPAFQDAQGILELTTAAWLHDLHLAEPAPRVTQRDRVDHAQAAVNRMRLCRQEIELDEEEFDAVALLVKYHVRDAPLDEDYLRRLRKRTSPRQPVTLQSEADRIGWPQIVPLAAVLQLADACHIGRDRLGDEWMMRWRRAYVEHALAEGGLDKALKRELQDAQNHYEVHDNVERVELKASRRGVTLWIIPVPAADPKRLRQAANWVRREWRLVRPTLQSKAGLSRFTVRLRRAT